MDKVYLLLRHNEQKGPLSLQELVQLGLQPHDLIWIEGKSRCWSFPAEIDVLASYVSPGTKTNEMAADAAQRSPTNPQANRPESASVRPAISTQPPTPTHPHIFVSMPGAKASPDERLSTAAEKTLEQKADELKRKIEAYVLEHSQTTTEAEALYKPRSLHELKDEYATWLRRQHDHRKRRSFKRTGMATLITLLVLGVGYVLAKDTLLSKRAAATGFAVKNELHSQGSQLAKKGHMRKAVPKKDTSLLLTDSTLLATQANPESVAPNKKKNTHISRSATVTIPVPKLPDMAKAEPASMPPLAHPVEENKTTANDSALSQKTGENKSTLGKKISNFFNRLGKKRKEKETEIPGTTARLLPDATVALTSLSNTPSGDPAFKVTLYNSAAKTITNAVVELRYYSDKNDLLEKRLIHFAGVPPKATAALTVPGNRSAHHTSYQLITVDN